jgi:hypothetical protein
MTPAESELLEAFLAHDFPGVEVLRAQISGLMAKRGCKCGCGTIDLIPQGKRLPKSSVHGWLPVSGHVLDEHGDTVGGVLIFVDDGLLSTLEVYSFDQPIQLPRVANVDWQV